MENHVRSVRLKVLLNHFYGDGDHRQKAFVILQKSWSTVLDLQEHIQRVLKLPGSVYLTVDNGIMLPTSESIGVVSETDEITVHPEGSTFSMLANAFAQARIESTAESTPGAYTSGMSSPGLGSGAPKKFKKDPVQTVRSSLSEGRCSKWVQDMVTLEPPRAKSVDLSEKPKRKRKRKRKNPQTVTEAMPPHESLPPVGHQQARNDNILTPSRSHVRFDLDEPRIEDNSSQENVQLSNNPFALPAKARVIRATVQKLQMNVISEKPPPIIPNVPVIMEAESEIASQTPSKTEAEPENREAALETMRKHIDQLNLNPVENCALKENDLIAFKMMKLTDNYVPDLSAYIIGLVQSIDESNVIIFVMAGLDETREPCGKFSLDPEDSPENSVDQKLLYIQLNEILHAKFVTL